MDRPLDPRIEAEVEQLRSMRKADLRALWRAKVKSEPPKAFGPDLLRRSLAQKIQEDAYGGLSLSSQRILDRLVKTMQAKPHGRIELPRRIKPGAVLLRDYNKKTHRVMVLADGFAYDGETYPSLSEIARVITGTKWNGPRFFGLRAKAKAKERGNNEKPTSGTLSRRAIRPQLSKRSRL